jgi:hypothetical protein
MAAGHRHPQTHLNTLANRAAVIREQNLPTAFF